MFPSSLSAPIRENAAEAADVAKIAQVIKITVFIFTMGALLEGEVPPARHPKRHNLILPEFRRDAQLI